MVLNMENKFAYNLTLQEINQIFTTESDMMIVIDAMGRLLSVNDPALDLFTSSRKKKQDELSLENICRLNSPYHALFEMIREYYFLALRGVPQAFTWIDKQDDGQPIHVFNFSMNACQVDKETVIIVRLVDVTQSEKIEWVLRALSDMTNHQNIDYIIDEITHLVARAFNADQAMVNLVDNLNIAHTLSYYVGGKKQKNGSYSLQNSPCNLVKAEKRIHHYNGDVQTRFPEDDFLRQLNVHAYLGGPLIDSTGNVVGLLLVMHPHYIKVNSYTKTLFQLFSQRLSLEIERLLSQRKLQFLASMPEEDPNPIIRLQEDNTTAYANQAGREILNYWSEKGTYLPEVVIDGCEAAKQKKSLVRIELEINNSYYFFTIIWLEDFKQYTIYATDITELKRIQQKIRNLANYDTVTQIANRQHFEHTLNDWIAQIKPMDGQLALFLIDLDNFKQVNDTLGHQVGDKLLKTMAKRMESCLRQTDFVARLGGDEFVVLLQNSDPTSIAKVAEKINQAIAAPYESGEYHLETSCSIGISIFPADGANSIELLKNADIAMYRAKKNGKDQYCIFSQIPRDLHDNRLLLLKKDLKNAVKNH